MHRNDSYHTGGVQGSPELIPREILTAGGNRPMDAVLSDAPEPRQSGWDHELQFRRKPAVAGMRRLGVIGLGWVGQGFMQQAARLAQRAT
ncbi:MAG: hypothetical protein ABSE84_11370, partial [Isosphaeraceae bacterium]